MLARLRWSFALLLLPLAARPAHAQFTAQQMDPGICDEWCFEISYPGGYHGYACESGFSWLGEWMCTAQTANCDLEPCHMVLITVTLPPKVGQRNIGGS